MDRTRIPLFYALALLVGALLLAVGGWRHPVLSGDGAAQLQVIADTAGWRSLHLLLVFGFPLVVAGLIGLLGRHINTPGAAAARAGMFLSVCGYGMALVGVLFMVGVGPALARAYTGAEMGLTATHAVFVYDMLHPFALLALRVGAFTVGLATYAFGWAVVGGRVLPHWLGWAGVGAGAVGAGLGLALNENAPQVMGGVALATVWQVLVAVALVRERPAAV